MAACLRSWFPSLSKITSHSLHQQPHGWRPCWSKLWRHRSALHATSAFSLLLCLSNEAWCLREHILSVWICRHVCWHLPPEVQLCMAHTDFSSSGFFVEGSLKMTEASDWKHCWYSIWHQLLKAVCPVLLQARFFKASLHVYKKAHHVNLQWMKRPQTRCGMWHIINILVCIWAWSNYCTLLLCIQNSDQWSWVTSSCLLCFIYGDKNSCMETHELYRARLVVAAAQFANNGCLMSYSTLNLLLWLYKRLKN